MSQEYEKRVEEFAEIMERLEGDELVGLAVATGEWLERLTLKPEAVAVAMRALYTELAGAESLANHDTYYGHSDWRELWANFGDENLKSTGLFVTTHAYAFFGLWPDLDFFGIEAEDGQSDIDIIARLVSLGRSFVNSIPAGWGSPRDLVNTVIAAEARLAIDSGEDVTTVQLAALSRLSLKSIKNLVAPGNSAETIKLNNDSKVPSGDAKRWLEARDDFRDSIWHLRNAVDGNVVKEGPLDPTLEDILFVPVAKDGTIFDPELCKRADGYIIGDKGVEEKEPGYLTALSRLTHMPLPHWRRPNGLGHWGIVTGVSWVRKTRSELGLPAASDMGVA